MRIDGQESESRPQLLAAGVSESSLRRANLGQNWMRLRHGAYLRNPAEVAGEARCLAVIRATVPLLAERSVLSHESAALWRGLPLVRGLPSKVHVLRRDADGGFRRGHIHCHVGEVDDNEIDVIEGVLVTSVARTVVDCARTLSREAGLVLADTALHQGLASGDDLGEQLLRAHRRVGIRQARWVLGFADARSESPGESISRLRIHEFGLPTPDLQFEVCDETGLFVARTDFHWEASGTVGEFDGRTKYGRHLRPDESPGDAVYREKRREDRIRNCRKEVVRWGWSDCDVFSQVADQLRRAFARGARH